MSREHVKSLALQHTSLLTSIASVDYAPAALVQQTALVATLTQALAKQDKDIVALERKVRWEKKDFDELKNSTMHRLSYKLTGQKAKFESKTTKEEKEYLEALENLKNARIQRGSTKEMLDEAEQVLSQYDTAAQQHRHYSNELQDLYDMAFNGPSPAFTDEDILENAVTVIQGQYVTTQMTFAQESQALNCLKQAERAMQNCTASLKEARSASSMDMWGGGTLSDMMERNALSSAQGYAHQVQMHITYATQAQPLVRSIGPMQIAQGSIMSDVLFDNIFSDMAFDEKIKTSQIQVHKSSDALSQQLKESQGRLEKIKPILDQRSSELQQRRSELMSKRREILEAIASGDGARSEMAFPEPNYAPPPTPLRTTAPQ